MPSSMETEKIARKLLPIIYVIDTSGSMEGDRISSVNEAMYETVDLLKEVSEDNPTAELKIGVLQFSSNAKWVTNGLIYMEDYFWNDLKAGGLTTLGAALEELNRKLSRKEFMVSDVGFKAPVIIFMSDGYPTDDYIRALKKTESENKWYKIATKIAIGVGDDFDRDAMAQIAGNKEAVIQVTDKETLKKLIRVVSVTASQIGSKSKTDESQINEVLAAVKTQMGDDPDLDMAEIPEPAPSAPSPAPAAATSGWNDDWN